MDALTYNAEASRFALYPEVGTGSPLALSYASLGLVGEAGELLVSVEATDGHTVDEMGDVAWYVAALCREAGLGDITPVDDGRTTEVRRPLDQMAGMVLLEASELAEATKRVLRDGRSPQTLAEPLGNVVLWLSALATGWGTTMDEVRARNIVKLEDRQRRDVIHGEGDNR